MPLRRISLLVTGCALLLASCSDSPFAPTRSSAIAAQDSAALFRTDAATYAFTSTDIGSEGRIRATLTNRTGRTLYFVNCNGGTSLELQRLEGDQWKAFWSPVLLSCLSPPITVPDGGTRLFDISVFAGRTGSKYYPQFASALRTGLYRVIWHDAYFSYQDRLPWGEPVPESQRVSNSFVITAP